MYAYILYFVMIVLVFSSKFQYIFEVEACDQPEFVDVMRRES